MGQLDAEGEDIRVIQKPLFGKTGNHLICEIFCSKSTEQLLAKKNEISCSEVSGPQFPIFFGNFYTRVYKFVWFRLGSFPWDIFIFCWDEYLRRFISNQLQSTTSTTTSVKIWMNLLQFLWQASLSCPWCLPLFLNFGKFPSIFRFTKRV